MGTEAPPTKSWKIRKRRWLGLWQQYRELCRIILTALGSAVSKRNWSNWTRRAKVRDRQLRRILEKVDAATDELRDHPDLRDEPARIGDAGSPATWAPPSPRLPDQPRIYLGRVSIEPGCTESLRREFGGTGFYPLIRAELEAFAEPEWEGRVREAIDIAPDLPRRSGLLGSEGPHVHESRTAEQAPDSTGGKPARVEDIVSKVRSGKRSTAKGEATAKIIAALATRKETRATAI